MKLRIIVQMMGSPVKYILGLLEEIPKKLEKTGHKAKKLTIAEPEKVGDKYYSSFIELETEAKDLTDLFDIIIDYGPSSVEIIEPLELKVSAADLQKAVGTVSAILHEMDKAIKVSAAQNKMLQKEILKLRKELSGLKSGEKSRKNPSK